MSNRSAPPVTADGAATPKLDSVTPSVGATTPIAGVRNRLFDLLYVRLIAGFIFLVTVYGASQLLLQATLQRAPIHYLHLAIVYVAAALCLAMLLAYWICIRVLERRQAEEIALDKARHGLLNGAMLGLILFGCVYLIIVDRDGVTAQWQGWSVGVTLSLALAAISGVGEELIFRGLVYRNLEQSLGTFTALVLSAAFFGAVHMLNAHATAVSSAAIALEAGLLLGATYVLTRNLWFPIGVHFAWNFSEGGLMGAGLSGVKLKGVYKSEFSGPEWLTGGAFGPEASAVAVGVCLFAALLILALALNAGRWYGFRLRLRADPAPPS
jgi:membrane protease YdiL (CAAX protease family)